jgi:uncharacterized protein with PIN domain
MFRKTNNKTIKVSHALDELKRLSDRPDTCPCCGEKVQKRENEEVPDSIFELIEFLKKPCFCHACGKEIPLNSQSSGKHNHV